jgi:DNA (cytosine-5)-methyltransferase 1
MAGRTTFRFVDLFAGIGGFRLALEAVGGKCVYSVEIDRFARKTYEANFGRCEAMDIADVTSLPQHEILAAGFPCQPFSLAGVSKKVSLGKAHGFLDIRHGNLFFQIVRLLKIARPPVLLLENVKNLLSHDGGRTFAVISAELDAAGYEVSHRVIDARAWVPQHRERTFIVGLRRDVYGGQRFAFPPEPEGRPLLGQILDSEPDPRYTISLELWSYLKKYADKHRAAGNGFGYGLFGPSDVARTLSARYYKDGSEILITTGGEQPRRLSPRECARLMGFPPSFKIPVSDTQAYRQFGNSVVVQVVEHIARAIVTQAGLRNEQLALSLDRPAAQSGKKQAGDAKRRGYGKAIQQNILQAGRAR